MVRQLRMQFFALTLLLKALSDSKAVDRLWNVRPDNSHDPRAAGLLLGYRLIIEAALYRQIELMVTFPEILYLQLDEDLCRWWRNADEKNARRFLNVAQNDSQTSTSVAKFINDLLLRVVRTGIDWEKFTDVSADVSSFARLVLSLAGNCQVTLLSGEGLDPHDGLDRCSRLCASEYLHDLVYDDHDDTLSQAFDYTRNESLEWVEGGVFQALDIDGIDTSREVIGTRPLRLKSMQEFAGPGINIALEVAVSELTNQERTIRGDASCLPPKSELFGDFSEEFQAGRWPSLQYGLVFRDGPLQKTLEKIMSRETTMPDPEEYLRALLGKDAFLANSKGTRAVFHLQVLIEGLAKVQPAGTPVELLQIEHVGDPDEPHPPVSVAVRVGRDWHVFYYIDAVGRMTSGIWPFLDEFGDRVHMQKIEGVSTDLLLSLCDRPFQYVSRQWKSQKDINSHLRGVIPELLANLLLTRLGFFPVKPLVQLGGIGELDGLGYRKTADGGECMVLEVKKESTSQTELKSEIAEFTRKVRLIRQDPSTVEEVLGRLGAIETVSGIFISMAEVGKFIDMEKDEPEFLTAFLDTKRPKADFKSFLDGLEDVEFWDYNRFNVELDKADLPKVPVRLLERAGFIWELSGSTVDDQSAEWNILQKAVENDDWMWPESSDPLIAAFDDILGQE